MVGDLRAEQQAPRITGNLELLQTQLPHGVHHHHLAPTPLEIHQGAHESWVIGCRIASDEKDRIALVDVGEGNRGGARARHAGQTHSGSLVTVEGAVVDVVRTVKPSNHLKQKPRFVARSA